MLRQILKKVNAAIHYVAMTIAGALILFFAVLTFLQVYDWWAFKQLQQFVKLPYVSTPTIAKLTTDNDIYLVAYGPAESSLLELHKDGTYTTRIRMHLGSINSDEGTWSISGNGDIALKSDKRFHDIYVDRVLWISVDRKIFSDLPEIKKSLQILLKSSSEDLIPYDKLVGVKEYQGKYGKIKAIHCYSEGPVARDVIIKTINNIEAYQNKTGQNIFYWRPITYKSFLFMVNTDDHWYTVDKFTNKIVTTIDNHSENESFAFFSHDIFTAITPEYFNYETEQPESFKFVKMFCF